MALPISSRSCLLFPLSLGVSLGFLAEIWATPQAIALDPPSPVAVVTQRLLGAMLYEPEPHAAIQMTTCRVTLTDADPVDQTERVFLYQEQAVVKTIDQPYRQRFLQIAPGPEAETVLSISYRPLVTQAWINLCDRPFEERQVKRSDFQDSHCQILLRREGESYVGSTPAAGCPSQYRGAVRVHNTIRLDAAEMETRDQGFDAAGNLVWGKTDQSYHFYKVGP